ncbi:MAG: hypothetical protein AAFQ98_20390 [Bacteroidota bacterium]
MKNVKIESSTGWEIIQSEQLKTLLAGNTGGTGSGSSSSSGGGPNDPPIPPIG